MQPPLRPRKGHTMNKLTKRKGTDIIVCRREGTKELIAVAGTVLELAGRNLLLEHDVPAEDMNGYLILPATAGNDLIRGTLYRTREDCKAALMAL